MTGHVLLDNTEHSMTPDVTVILSIRMANII